MKRASYRCTLFDWNKYLSLSPTHLTFKCNYFNETATVVRFEYPKMRSTLKFSACNDRFNAHNNTLLNYFHHTLWDKSYNSVSYLTILQVSLSSIVSKSDQADSNRSIRQFEFELRWKIWRKKRVVKKKKRESKANFSVKRQSAVKPSKMENRWWYRGVEERKWRHAVCAVLRKCREWRLRWNINCHGKWAFWCDALYLLLWKMRRAPKARVYCKIPFDLCGLSDTAFFCFFFSFSCRACSERMY